MHVVKQWYEAACPLESLRRHPRNYRRGDLGKIGESIDANGFYGAVIAHARTREILAGNHRHLEAERLGAETIPVIWVDLDEATALRILAADNATSDAATNDPRALADLLDTIRALAPEGAEHPLRGTGYDDAAVALLLAEIEDSGKPGGGDEQGDGSGQRGPTLVERFGVPPFTILDARQGYWQERKRQWIALGIRGELGRGDMPGDDGALTQPAPVGDGGLCDQLAPREKTWRRSSASLGERVERAQAKGDESGLKIAAARKAPRPGGKGATAPADRFGVPYEGGDAWRPSAKADNGRAHGASFRVPEGEYEYPVDQLQKASGTSIFDPVLCELVYRWFCPPGGHVLDPFAGEATKGVVAAYLGHPYTAVELRPEQIRANESQWREIGARPDCVGKPAPRWIVGDSERLAEYLPPAPALYDLIFTSPPYYDLEIYSQSEKDGSAFETYERFMEWYRTIFRQAVARLADNRFVVVKIGDVRDRKTGAYRNFLGDNIRCFMDLGLAYYNEAVLITAVGSLPVRAGRIFGTSRKLGKAHQNVLVFYKGDPRRIGQHFPAEVEHGAALPDAAPEAE